ncbi:uncharacterized protein LOC127748768 [Frankliniella occidentalis]|uniref:Uncharacterized protein LOC127748768 n=1 Tax=Frankliniella occidentalis TaxID=133901 RepID=A0A9C6TYY8_FRAOC|nr:uncharacterized protein LOC127748768 [Frankliniella occidentalis]
MATMFREGEGSEGSEDEIDELERYFRDAKAVSSEDLLAWWKSAGAYPRLQLLAMRILAISATSASSETVFSKAGFILSDRRKRLAPKTVDAIIFLHQHLNSRRRFENGEDGEGQ